MPSFRYRARDGRGGETRGRLEAADSAAAVAQLRRSDLFVLSLDRSDAPGTRDAKVATGRPPSAEFERSLQQIALMLRSGLPILSALRSSSELAASRASRRSWAAVAADIEEGQPFSKALQNLGHVSPVVVQLARAGETSGTLDAALVRAAAHLERRRKLRSTIVQAFFYPTIVIAATTAVTSYMVVSVIPNLETFLAGFNRRLPPITQLLLTITHWLNDNMLALLVVMAAVVLGLLALDRFLPSRRVIDRVLHRLPVVGKVRRMATTAVFGRTLAVLLDSGVDILGALSLTEDLMGRPVAREGVRACADGLRRGQPFSEAIGRCPAFSRVLPSIAAVGEQTGNLDRVLEELAVHEESELAAWIARANSLIEPILTITVGLIVGFVYVAFFVSLFAITGAGA